jgi:ABC-type transport system involved in Fe-S cluster assembly fused permease/ATPase subunit
LVSLIFKKLSFKSGFVIAYRLSTIRNANSIITLDRGYIIQQGTHDKLISEEKGLYKKLYEMQLRDNDGL